MGSLAHPQSGYDTTDVPLIFRGAIRLGLIESAVVLLLGLVSRLLDGPVELGLEALLLIVGLALVCGLPGRWTRARTIEGIAGAAGIGLAASAVFLVVDVILFQPLHLYTNRWLEIGGGSNWWYHPVWWMVGTYLPWLGAWILANQTAKSGSPSVPGMMVLAGIATVVCAVAAVLIGIPLAGWNLATFGVAFLPGLALATVISGLGARRP